ncbi:hypothetical protein Nepgr_020342 [Nepenthes gracilis]|uniref:Uncharacterized protein n=1 Tax=Nepenthes gracilis TaxID=150966 RepID=A0AAD3SYV5_NEPGR|nr:hypothetical protein Nepgr_020342 [Nepenthes gracilis]
MICLVCKAKPFSSNTAVELDQLAKPTQPVGFGNMHSSTQDHVSQSIQLQTKLASTAIQIGHRQTAIAAIKKRQHKDTDPRQPIRISQTARILAQEGRHAINATSGKHTPRLISLPSQGQLNERHVKQIDRPSTVVGDAPAGPAAVADNAVYDSLDPADAGVLLNLVLIVWKLLGSYLEFGMLIRGVRHTVSLDPSWNGSWVHLGCCLFTYGEEDGVIVKCCAAARYLQLLFTELAHVGMYHVVFLASEISSDVSLEGWNLMN